MMFTLVLYHFTNCRQSASYTVTGDRLSVWTLWHTLTSQTKEQVIVEVYNLQGIKQQPEKGTAGLFESQYIWQQERSE